MPLLSRLLSSLPRAARPARAGVALAALVLAALAPSAPLTAQAAAQRRGGGACVAVCDPAQPCPATCTGSAFPALGRLAGLELYVRGESHELFSLITTVEAETGLGIRFVGLRRHGKMSFGAETIHADDLLATLALYGIVAVSEQPGAPESWREARVSFRLWDRGADELALAFTQAFGTNVTFHPHDPSRRFQLTARHARGEDVLGDLARWGRVTIDGEEVPAR